MGRKAVEKEPEEDEDDRDDEDEEEQDEDDGPKSQDGDQDEEEDGEEGDDLDSALNDRGGRPSIFIEPWRKSGKTVIWLHPKAKFAKVPHHKWFEPVSFEKRNGETVSFIRFTRFISHEPPDFVQFSKERNDDLRRTHRAQVCPMSKMIEWVDDEVLAGRLAPEAVVFRFEDGDPEHTVELHAAGLTGLIGLDDFPERMKKQCKKAKVLQKDPWNENLGLKMLRCFQVVEDANPSELKFALEPVDLFEQLKKAIATEKERSGDDKGDPRRNPYAFLWKFDQVKAKKDYGRGNSVTPQPGRMLTNKIRKLLNGPKRTDQDQIVSLGNCLELRASMENANANTDVVLPFDEIFAAAEKAGLMKASASAKSKPTQPKKDDEPKSEPQPKTSTKTKSTAANGKPGKAPDPVPADEDDDPDSKKSDVPAATCDICQAAIGEEDTECAQCDSTFSVPAYQLDGVKCTECGKIVPLVDGSDAGDDTLHICEKCGTTHRLSPSVAKYYTDHKKANDGGKRCELKFVWSVEKPKKETKTEPKRSEERTGRRGRGASDSDKLDGKLKGDKLPF
jgi:hypothetical protein